MPGIRTETMTVNMGPQHPSTHGVLRLVLELDGETVVRCIPHIGYLHCGFEKIGEYRQYNQIIPWTDREDYLNSPGNNVAFALGAEQLFGIEITERCKVLRVILMELSRIISHLVWLGTTCIDIGGRHAGVLSAAMNTSGQIGGILSPIVLAYIVEYFANWAWPLYVMAALYLMASISWLLIRPDLPLEGRPPES